MIKKWDKKWATKSSKNETKNGQKNVQKSDQKATPKNDQRMSDSYHKELPSQNCNDSKSDTLQSDDDSNPFR